MKNLARFMCLSAPWLPRCMSGLALLALVSACNDKGHPPTPHYKLATAVDINLNPERYDGEHVLLSGFFRYDGAENVEVDSIGYEVGRLYETDTAYAGNIATYTLRIVHPEPSFATKVCDGHYVTVTGRLTSKDLAETWIVPDSMYSDGTIEPLMPSSGLAREVMREFIAETEAGPGTDVTKLCLTDMGW